MHSRAPSTDRPAGPASEARAATVADMPRRLPEPPPELTTRPRRSRDLRAGGITKAQVAGPRWTRIVRGVHGYRADPADPMTRILAVAELMPTGAAIGGWAALFLHRVRDLDGRTGPGGATLLPVPVCIGPPGRMASRNGIAVDRSRLAEADVTEVGGIRVTSAVRACVDIACWHGVEEGMVAGDAAVRFGAARAEEIRAYVATRGSVRGIPWARTAAALVDGHVESCPESRLRFVWIREAGLPVPLVNPDVVDLNGGFRVGRSDLLGLDAALVGEYDGDGHCTLAQHTADNEREESFERLGLTVVRATALDLWPRRARLVARLQAGWRDGLARDRSRDRWGYRVW